MSAARARLHRLVAVARAHPGGAAGVGILAMFALAALLAPVLFSSAGLDITRATGAEMAPPSAGYPLGTDETGRSVLALLFWGARTSLVVGLAATAISMAIGATVGIASGYYRGLGSTLLQRLTEWFLVIPFLPLVIVLATVVGRSFLNVVIVIGVTSWAGTARLVRSQTLTVSARPFVERARALGAGDLHVMRYHVLPNVAPLIVANTTLTVAIAILSETTLSFVGLGVPFSVSWGTLIEGAFSSGAVSRGAWWYLVPPGLCVVAVVLAFILIGRSIEGTLNPRLTGR